MADFVADIRDLKFALFEQLDLKPLFASEKYGSFSREDFEMIVDEGYKLAKEVLWPTNAPGDKQGCTFKDGKVTVPDVYLEPFKTYVENGWLSLNMNPEFGGQGAPECLMIASCESFFGANISFSLGPLLTAGCAHLIESFGSDELKNIYCEKMYTGKWFGTMCLTEPQAGSDVGASTTKAIPQGDHYLIEGEKIFITYGEHNATENIIHAVLARIEGAPKGTAGLSLFLVPKYRVNSDDSLGELNDVVCSGIEHKLGIHGSPTCSMVFGQNGNCHGYLLGEPNDGMKAMFQMMNEARVSVGLQGAALANGAYQAALAFAKERLQGSDIREMKNPDAPRVPIIKHADIRMNLLRQKAYAEGCRAIVLYTAYCEDRAKVATDDKTRNTFKGLTEILTPICKAYCSDMGFRVTEWAVQTFGGYGYCSEYPAEQYLRDCKIASIYEGTNGIQAMDLVGRKIGSRGGANLMALVSTVNNYIDANKEHPTLKNLVTALAAARDAWGEVNGFFMGSVAMKKFHIPLVNATCYLSLCGDFLVGYFLVQQAILAKAKLEEICKGAGVDPNDAKAVSALAKDNPDARYFDAKIKTASYFCSYELPQVRSKANAIKSSDMSALHIVFEDE